MGWFDDQGFGANSGSAPIGNGTGVSISPSHPNAVMPMPTSYNQQPAISGGQVQGTTSTGGNLPDPFSFIQNYVQQNGIQLGNERDGTTRKIVDAMRAAGYNVSYETPDEYGRSSGIILNGVPTKIWNGSGQLIVKPYSEAEPQGGGGFTGGGSFGNGLQGGPFQMPSMADLQGTPYYQFALDQGNRAIQNSAAAKGTLLTGGTLKDLAQFNIGAAGSLYPQFFNMAKSTHDTNFGDLFNLSGQGATAAANS